MHLLGDLVNRLNKVDWNYQQADDPSAFRDGQTAVEKAKKEIDGLPAGTLNNLSTDPKLVKDAKFWVEDALKKVGGKPIVAAKEKVQVDYFENFKNSSQSLEGDFLKIIKRFKDQFVIKFKKGAPFLRCSFHKRAQNVFACFFAPRRGAMASPVKKHT